MRLHKALCSWTAGLSLFGPRRTLLSASDTSLNARNHARVRAASSSRTEEHKSNATQLLRYWRGMLSKVTDEDTADSQTRWKTKDMQDLLHTALRVRHGRVSGVMPEQLLATFMEIYTFAMGPEDRKRLFLLICRDFGVQGTLCKVTLALAPHACCRAHILLTRNTVQHESCTTL